MYNGNWEEVGGERLFALRRESQTAATLTSHRVSMTTEVFFQYAMSEVI